MKRLILFLVMAVILVGCASSQPVSPGIDEGLGSLIDGAIIDSDAGVPDAKSSMWPFSLCGILTMLSGVGYFVWKKDIKMLLAGMAIAAVPPFFFLFFTPLVPYVGVGVLIAGILMLARLAYWVYDGIEDDIKAERKADRAS